MLFNKNQSLFPSKFHREVWWWAIGLVPPNNSLIDEVKCKCLPDVLEGCYQWYNLFQELCEDMYIHADEYIPASTRQYRDILEYISAHGRLQDSKLYMNITEWNSYVEKMNKSKAYVTIGISLSKCLKALERTGLKHEYTKNNITFKYEKYKKIFNAMQTMENSPDIRKTPVRNHFAHCEFRQLFKSYSPNYDELLRRASDDSLYIVHSIHDFAKSLKIHRYIHFGIIKYKYKGERVLDFNLYGDEYPTLRINICTFANIDIDINEDNFYRHIIIQKQAMQDEFINSLIRCEDKNHRHQNLILNNQEVSICPYAKVRMNPLKGDLNTLLCLITARKASIDQYYS